MKALAVVSLVAAVAVPLLALHPVPVAPGTAPCAFARGNPIDRLQVAPCGSFSGDGAMTLAYTAIAYVTDDPKSNPVNIHLAALFRH